MAVKRRVIWLSDEDWARAQERAKALNLNVSQYVSKLIEWLMSERALEQIRTIRPVPKPSQRGK